MDRKRDYFEYKGVKYGVGTLVLLKPEQYGSGRQIERCHGIAKFVEGYESGYLKFQGLVPKGENPCWIGVRTSPDDRIEKILDPVPYEYKPAWEKALENYKKTSPALRPDIAPGTILYIAVMIVGAIFKDAIGIWILATFFYLKYLVNMYTN